MPDNEITFLDVLNAMSDAIRKSAKLDSTRDDDLKVIDNYIRQEMPEIEDADGESAEA